MVYAKGDSNAEESSRINTIAIQNAINAAYVIGMAAANSCVIWFYYCDELTLLPVCVPHWQWKNKIFYGATVYLTNPSNLLLQILFEGLLQKKHCF